MIVIDEVHKCLDYETLIKTDKGNLKIGEIVNNEIKCNVLSYNEVNHNLEYKPVVNYYKNYTGNSSCVKVSTETKDLVCSGTHKIFTVNRGWIEAKNLNIGDEAIVICGYKTEKIKSIQSVPNKEYMYDLEVEDNHNYFGNEILVHNCKNLESAQGQGILKLDNSASKMAMTGTLLVNNPLDLYCPMSFIGLINQNKWYFERQYVIKDEWKRVIRI